MMIAISGERVAMSIWAESSHITTIQAQGLSVRVFSSGGSHFEITERSSESAVAKARELAAMVDKANVESR